MFIVVTVCGLLSSNTFSILYPLLVQDRNSFSLVQCCGASATSRRPFVRTSSHTFVQLSVSIPEDRYNSSIPLNSHLVTWKTAYYCYLWYSKFSFLEHQILLIFTPLTCDIATSLFFIQTEILLVFPSVSLFNDYLLTNFYLFKNCLQPTVGNLGLISRLS